MSTYHVCIEINEEITSKRVNLTFEYYSLPNKEKTNGELGPSQKCISYL